MKFGCKGKQPLANELKSVKNKLKIKDRYEICSCRCIKTLTNKKLKR